MSLKAVHIFFISLASLLTLGFGYWAIRDYFSSKNFLHLLLGIGSFIGTGILTTYLVWFIAKMRKVNPR